MELLKIRLGGPYLSVLTEQLYLKSENYGV